MEKAEKHLPIRNAKRADSGGEPEYVQLKALKGKEKRSESEVPVAKKKRGFQRRRMFISKSVERKKGQFRSLGRMDYSLREKKIDR